MALIERSAGEPGALVSVDTYKPAVARAAIAAGAAFVKDVSGLRDPELADVCAADRRGAGRDAHERRRPQEQRLQDPDLYDDVVEEVMAFLSGATRARAVHAASADRQLIVDPGPDFAKTPAQTIELLGRGAGGDEFGEQLLLAVSRKDFVGALTGRAPRERGAGTLAALAWGIEVGAQIFRVHDVAAAADYLTVRAALAGR